jgi:hypothetical protein
MTVIRVSRFQFSFVSLFSKKIGGVIFKRVHGRSAPVILEYYQEPAVFDSDFFRSILCHIESIRNDFFPYIINMSLLIAELLHVKLRQCFLSHIQKL